MTEINWPEAVSDQFQKETAERLADEIAEMLSRDYAQLVRNDVPYVKAKLVEAMQAQQATDLDMLKALQAERDRADRAEAAWRANSEALDEAERQRDSLRLELDGLEVVRQRGNAYLIKQRDEALALLRERRDASVSLIEWQRKGADMSQAVGKRVTCRICGHTKAPRGRSVPPQMYLCIPEECPGWVMIPWPGDLWPGETAEQFGYPCHGPIETEEEFRRRFGRDPAGVVKDTGQRGEQR